MDSLTLSEAKSRRAHIRAAATRMKSFVETFDPLQGSRHDITERKKKTNRSLGSIRGRIIAYRES